MIETVIKVGGSLCRDSGLPHLCRVLTELGARHPLLVVPGGGPFADAVRAQDRRSGLGATTAHWMAILAMDQYGWLLAELVKGSEPVFDLAAAQAVAQAGRVPILLPFAEMYSANPLPHSWSVTSDSIAAWFAAQVGAQLLVLLKDVDGICTGAPKAGTPGMGAESDLRKIITQDLLASCGGVDAHLSRLLPGPVPGLWIINGKQPERLAELVSEGSTIGTHYQPPLP